MNVGFVGAFSFSIRLWTLYEQLLCVSVGEREENWRRRLNLCQVLQWYLILSTLEVGVMLV